MVSLHWIKNHSGIYESSCLTQVHGICSLAHNVETVLVTKDKYIIANIGIVICFLILMLLFSVLFLLLVFSAVVALLPAVEVVTSFYL